MDIRRLDRGELVAAIGGIMLGVSLFLEWYSLGDKYTILNGCKGPGGGCTGWAALSIMRFLLLLAAVAPAILAYIIIRGHALSWPRGELTAVTALAALTLVLFRGVVDKPGTPPGQITVSYGWFLALLGGFLILIGAIARSRESGGQRRKPPGVL
jgi:hypothetical protein